MKTKEWDEIPFSNCLQKVKIGKDKQVKQKDYLKKGLYSVVDQGQSVIAGFSDDKSKVIDNIQPFIIFGDHTRILKYIDFPIVLGADGTKIIKPNNDFDTKFFFYFLKYLDIPSRGYNRHYTILKEKKISKPSLQEQKLIANVLSTVQEAIVLQEDLIAKLKNLKQSMMHHLFSKGTKGEKTKMTEIGEVPESWDVVELGKFAEFRNGINFSKSQKGNKGIKTIDVYNMYGGDRINVKLGDLYKVNKNIKNDYFLKNGDILFVRSSLKQEGVGWACCFNSSSEDIFSFCGFIIRARLNTADFNPEFLTLYFRSDIARKVLISGSGKVAITNINQDVLSNIKIPMPKFGEQDEIANSIFSIDQKIEATQEKISVYQNFFKTLLHELMNGMR